MVFENNDVGIIRRRSYLFYAVIGIVTAGILGFSYKIWYSQPSSITAYRSEDRPQIMKMLQDDWYWLVSEGATNFSPEYMLDHYAATYNYPDNSLSIAVYRNDEGKAVGFVTYHKLAGYQGRIQFLAVDSDYRKKGIGKLLINHALQALKNRGMCIVELAVRASNKRAYSLYTSLGFKEIWSTPDGFLGLSKELN